MKIPRRIILSRKGFDSKYGGCASPILADGTLVSMPIPEEGVPLQYRHINSVAGGCNLGDLVSKLKGNVSPNSGVHLDPDLRRELHGPGDAPWRPLFGQCDAAERHLEKQEVDKDDLFKGVQDVFSHPAPIQGLSGNRVLQECTLRDTTSRRNDGWLACRA